MNASGAIPEKGAPEKRRKAIQEVAIQENPHLILFQEFGWVGITGKTWEKSRLPDKYQYTGNKHGSIMYDTNELIIKILTQTDLQKPLDELIRKGKIQGNFTPIPRICIRKITTKGVPHMEFICVSWHGAHSKKKEDKKKDFSDLQVYLIELSERNGNIQIIVGGDFNISISDIDDIVHDELKLHKYEPTSRRTGSIIDFYLTSASVNLKNTSPLDLVKITSDANPLNLFDHDPIVATLSKPSSASTTATPK